MEAGIEITVKRALTPQKGGFLASGFTHTLNPYVGCAFGRVGCPFCYVRESPVGQFGPAAWGTSGGAVWAGGMGPLGAAESECRRGAGAGIAQTSRAALPGVHGLGNRPVPTGRGVGMPDTALFGSAALPSRGLARGTDALAPGTARFCSACRTAVRYAECEHRD